MNAIDEWSRIKQAQRVARERRDVLNRQRAEQVRVNATPQTLRKLERPVIDRLLQKRPARRRTAPGSAGDCARVGVTHRGFVPTHQ